MNFVCEREAKYRVKYSWSHAGRSENRKGRGRVVIKGILNEKILILMLPKSGDAIFPPPLAPPFPTVLISLNCRDVIVKFMMFYLINLNYTITLQSTKYLLHRGILRQIFKMDLQFWTIWVKDFYSIYLKYPTF